MIDSHCHLYFDAFDNDRDTVIAEAARTGVHTIINIGIDLPSSQMCIDLARQYDHLYATVGIHPHDAAKAPRDYRDRLQALAAHRKVVAIGEIGLDYYRDLSPRDIQQRVFREQLELAVATRLPIVIHTRDSFGETLEIVREYAARLNGGVFHCFQGTPEDALVVIDLGFVISVGGIITYNKAGMAVTARETPLDKILLETDAPFLTPVPFRGKLNQPAHVRYVRDKLAELKGISPAEVEKVTDRTCQKLFGLVELFGD
jgi:TatD DNase family protein